MMKELMFIFAVLFYIGTIGTIVIVGGYGLETVIKCIWKGPK